MKMPVGIDEWPTELPAWVVLSNSVIIGILADQMPHRIQRWADGITRWVMSTESCNARCLAYALARWNSSGAEYLARKAELRRALTLKRGGPCKSVRRWPHEPLGRA